MREITAKAVAGDYYRYKQSLSSASRSARTRVSDLGHPCTAYVALTRVAGETANRPDATLACIFDEGKFQEQKVIADLLAMGYRVEQSQKAIYWDEFDLSGHIDGFLTHEGMEDVLIDVKSISPFAFARFDSAADIEKAPQYFYRKWVDQIMMYERMNKVRRGMLVLKNKATGELKCIEVKRNEFRVHQLLDKALDIKEGVKLYEVDRERFRKTWLKGARLNDPDVCLECPLRVACVPDIDPVGGVMMFADADFEAKIDRHEKIKPIGAEYDSLHKEITENAKMMFANGSTLIIVGKWKVVGRLSHRRGFTVEEGDVWRTDIEMAPERGKAPRVPEVFERDAEKERERAKKRKLKRPSAKKSKRKGKKN